MRNGLFLLFRFCHFINLSRLKFSPWRGVPRISWHGGSYPEDERREESLKTNRRQKRGSSSGKSRRADEHSLCGRHLRGPASSPSRWPGQTLSGLQVSHTDTHTHRVSGSRITGRTHKRGERLLKSRHQYQGVVFGCSFQILCFDKNICDKLLKFNFNSAELIPALSQVEYVWKKHQLLKIESYWCVLLYFHFWQALKELKSGRGCVCQPWLGPATVLVLDIGAGSASEQLQRALLLAAIGGRVQRGVPQQICAVDVWRLLPAELQQTHGTRRDERPGPLNVLPPLFIVLLRAEARFFDFSRCASRSCCSRCCSSFFSDCRPVGGYCLLNNSTYGKVYFSLPSFHE